MTLNSEQRYIPDFVYWTVYDEKGEKYADCGTEKGAKDLCELNKDVQKLTWKRIDPPKPLPPTTVNVDAEALPADPQLKGQKILPESELQQLEL